MNCRRTTENREVNKSGLVRGAGVFLAVLIIALTVPTAFAADAWSERDTRTNVLALALNGFGSSTAVAYGYFEIDYNGSNPEQPVELAMSDFELGARFPLFNGVHIYLNDRIESYGHVRPKWAFYDSVSVGDGSFFPAVNDNMFFLELRIEQMGTTCKSMGPVHLIADIDEWPTPPGTVYRVEEDVNFKSVDSRGNYQQLGLTVHLDSNLCAWFYERGAVETELREVKRQGDLITLEGSVTSHSDSVFAYGWTFYSGGEIIEKITPHADSIAAQYGDFAGHDTLRTGDRHAYNLDVRMKRPGMERLYFLTAGREVDFVGDKEFIEVHLPDKGLDVHDMNNWRFNQGAQTEVTISGAGFREPLEIVFDTTGISAAEIHIDSPESLRAVFNIDEAAPPVDYDMTVKSDGRNFTVVDAVRVKTLEHVVTGVDLDKIVTGKDFTLNIHGERFPERVYVSLGDSVTLHDIVRKSDTEIQVAGMLSTYDESKPAVDVIVAGALHSAILRDAIPVEDGNPGMLASLSTPLMFLGGGLLLVLVIVAVVMMKRRGSSAASTDRNNNSANQEQRSASEIPA